MIKQNSFMKEKYPFIFSSNLLIVIEM